jgi:crotonobetainyl-CoA:carnitine CoA-transferase CaiB-like acyl-CoA transferase
LLPERAMTSRDRSTETSKHDARAIVRAIWRALGGREDLIDCVNFVGNGDLPSVFHVSDLAVACTAAAGLAMAEFVESNRGLRPRVRADRRLTSFWFAWSIRPQGWSPPPPWDPIAGDYQTADGWIRLHTNAPHHRAAALNVLDVAADRDRVAAAVRAWSADTLEAAIVENGGCAAVMRSCQQWATHPQGQAVGAEPLVYREIKPTAGTATINAPPDRPLQGIKVLDLTRVLAGPVATRFLAGFGADVLRIDSPDWDEPGIVPDVTLGKRCARLDLRTADGRDRLIDLLRRADVLVHGYRPGALERLGLGSDQCHHIKPGLVEVTLDAYGWSGPWRERRGFDSLVQMSSGIAELGMCALHRDRPTPLPVQALDHATGYLMAAAAVRGLHETKSTRLGSRWRLSLARTAALLTSLGTLSSRADLAAETPEDVAPDVETTEWGPARRLRPPLEIRGAPMRWNRPAGALGRSPSEWIR